MRILTPHLALTIALPPAGPITTSKLQCPINQSTPLRST